MLFHVQIAYILPNMSLSTTHNQIIQKLWYIVWEWKRNTLFSLTWVRISVIIYGIVFRKQSLYFQALNIHKYTCFLRTVILWVLFYWLLFLVLFVGPKTHTKYVYIYNFYSSNEFKCCKLIFYHLRYDQ